MLCVTDQLSKKSRRKGLSFGLTFFMSEVLPGTVRPIASALKYPHIPVPRNSISNYFDQMK